MSSSPSQDLSNRDILRLDRQDPYLRLLCVNIFVRDQERSLRFYTDQLGFSLVVDESYESGGRWVGVAPRHERENRAAVWRNAGSSLVTYWHSTQTE